MGFLCKISGYSRQQITRLIKQYRDTGNIKRQQPIYQGFERLYTAEDIRLLQTHLSIGKYCLTNTLPMLRVLCFEDRIVQQQLSRILQAIWEPEFRDCSYGFRPQRNAHQALARLGEIITNENTQWVVEADIKGFFDNVNHDWLMRFLEHRIKDSVFLRIIKRFLKAGVMEDGALTNSDTGTPQGGLVSPVLANIYLHYVLDIWFEKKFARSCQGRARLVRYADDCVPRRRTGGRSPPCSYAA